MEAIPGSCEPGPCFPLSGEDVSTDPALGPQISPKCGCQELMKKTASGQRAVAVTAAWADGRSSGPLSEASGSAST